MNESGDSDVVVVGVIYVAEHEGEAEPRARWDLQEDEEDEDC